MKNVNNGFSVVEVTVIAVVIGLVVSIGWIAYDRQYSQQRAASSDGITRQNNASQTKYQPIIPQDWVMKNDAVSGASYAVNSTWPDQTKITVYTINEDIPLGYGAPVSVRYNTATKAWEEYESGSKRLNTTIKVTEAKVMGLLPTAILESGDGETSELRILFVKGSEVIQLALPSVQGEPTNPYATHVEEVIKSINIK